MSDVGVNRKERPRCDFRISDHYIISQENDRSTTTFDRPFCQGQEHAVCSHRGDERSPHPQLSDGGGDAEV